MTYSYNLMWALQCVNSLQIRLFNSDLQSFIPNMFVHCCDNVTQWIDLWLLLMFSQNAGNLLLLYTKIIVKINGLNYLLIMWVCKDNEIGEFPHENNTSVPSGPTAACSHAAVTAVDSHDVCYFNNNVASNQGCLCWGWFSNWNSEGRQNHS